MTFAGGGLLAFGLYNVHSLAGVTEGGMLGMTLLLLGFGANGGTICLWEGIVLLLCFIGYLLYMFVMMKKGEMQAEEMESAKKPLWKMLIACVVGLGLIIWGSDLTVDAATALAKIFGMSEKFIGLTVVALGTSLPELFTSVIAAKKGKAKRQNQKNGKGSMNTSCHTAYSTR